MSLIITPDLYIEDVIKISHTAGNYIEQQIGKVTQSDIEEKELNSLVSYVDKTAEVMIVDQLSSIFPEAGFITEEDSVVNEEKEASWIIDPLDGTTNFLKGIPYFCVSIGLKYQGQIILGVVYEISTQDTYHAILNKGAFMNDKKLTMPKRPLKDVMIATGFPYRNDYDSSTYLAVIQHMLMHTRGLRRMGSAALDLCYVATNRFGVYFESYLNAWDVAAGSLIVKEAGGVISYFNGEQGYNDGTSILACHPSNHEELLKILKPLIN